MIFKNKNLIISHYTYLYIYIIDYFIKLSNKVFLVIDLFIKAS